MLCLVGLFYQEGTAQQESQFTQFMHNRLTINPAFAGVPERGTITAIYRRQWAGFDKAPTSKLISFNAPFAGNRVGFGLTVANYTAGITNSWNAAMAYSYKLPVSKEAAFRVGIQGAMRYYGFDFAEPSIYIKDPDDPSFSQNTENKFTGNFGLGLYFNYKQFYAGASVPYLFPNEITLNRQTRVDRIAQEVPHAYFMTGATIPVNRKIDFAPNLLVKYVNNSPVNFDINLSMIFEKAFTAGVSYRTGTSGTSDSVDLLAMYQYKNLGFGVAYDLGLSEINNYHNGSFEVLLRYDFGKEENDMANPRFFF